MNKSDLLDWLQEENRKWEALLESIGPERMDEPGVNGDWSMKDMVGHISTWVENNLAGMQAAIHGKPRPASLWPEELNDDDSINAWIYQHNRDKSVDEVLGNSRRVLEELLAAVESLPDDVRIEPDYHVVQIGEKRYWAGEFFHHFHDDHEADVRAWLARIKN